MPIVCSRKCRAGYAKPIKSCDAYDLFLNFFPMNTKILNGLVSEAKDYVLGLLTAKLPGCYLYHSVQHTLSVYHNVSIIGHASGLDPQELSTCQIAALFHDTGYIKSFIDHEEISTSLAKDFQKSRNIKNGLINQIEDAIMATKVPQKPHSLVEEVLCDADLIHLSLDNYFEVIELMRWEWVLCGRKSLSPLEFDFASLEFFESHRYHTEYGQRILAPLKDRNYVQIKNKISQQNTSKETA